MGAAIGKGLGITVALLHVATAALAQQVDPAPGDEAEVAPTYESPNVVRSRGDAACALEPLCLGPVVTFGLPTLVGIGVHARVTKYWGLGLDYQLLPTLNIDSVMVSSSSLTLEGRLHPLGDAFFLGAGLVYRRVTGEGRATVFHPDTAQQIDLDGEGELGLPLFKLGIGWLGGSGFVMGIDLSLEIPLGRRDLSFRTGGSEGSEVFDDEIAALQGDIEDEADKLVDLIPLVVQINLLRLGYMF